MKGINHFSASRFYEGRASAGPINCVFISYSRKDREDAIRVADMIRDLGIGVYFDQYDTALQLADEQDNHQKVVECIDNGITHSTALLGIITENTKESWWVPYEIGSANGHGISHAHLVTKEVKRLPSYIQASTILPSIRSLDEWLSQHLESHLSKTELLFEQLERVYRGHYKSASLDPVPIYREIGDLTFYQKSP
ncbi:MAG TPA: toll/interleukin-1 receptor domain-containing protein [Haloferula sp.]